MARTRSARQPCGSPAHCSGAGTRSAPPGAPWRLGQTCNPCQPILRSAIFRSLLPDCNQERASHSIWTNIDVIARVAGRGQPRSIQPSGQPVHSCLLQRRAAHLTVTRMTVSYMAGRLRSMCVKTAGTSVTVSEKRSATPGTRTRASSVPATVSGTLEPPRVAALSASPSAALHSLLSTSCLVEGRGHAGLLSIPLCRGPSQEVSSSLKCERLGPR